MLITNEVFSDFLKCKYKAYQKLNGKQEDKSEYEILQIELEQEYKECIVKKLFANDKRTKNFGQASLTTTDLIKGNDFIINPTLTVDDLSLHFDVLEKVTGKSKLCGFYYIAVNFNKNSKVTKENKLLNTFNNLALSIVQGKISEYGKIIYGEQFQTSKINTNAFLPQIKSTLDEIREFTHQDKELKFSIMDRCRECEFCKAYAVEKDDLSLLRGMPAKEIIKYNNKGIFTVTQFSYIFRARKRSKRMPPRRNSIFTLKALAIREKKIYVFENPQLSEDKVQMYLDIEGNEQNTFHYLIGLLILENGLEKRYSFWANNLSEEEKILQQFLSICNQYKVFTLFHYGSYEKQYLQRIKKKFPKKYDEFVDNTINKSVNILSIIYLNIYFPTYTNELKEIANYLDFQWTEKNASGIQSLVWRTRWEMTQNEEFKQKLIQYNLEDCIALRMVTNSIYKILKNINSEVIYVSDIKRKSIYNFDENYASDDIKFINESSFFDYQRERVHVRTNKRLKKYYRKIQNKNRVNTINKIIDFKISECRFCKCTNLSKIKEFDKYFTDVEFFKNGVKRWRVKYVGGQFECSQCKRTYFTKEFKQVQGRYGHNIKSLVFYQHIVHNQSLIHIQKYLLDVFGIFVDDNTLRRMKAYGEKYYSNTCEQILKNILQSKVIYVDETPIDMRYLSGYVWTFTTEDAVIFIYKSTREGDFLREFLKDFKGILVSDFYPAYDSLDCLQQKCLIHLIRDFNDDLLKNPFDEEFKSMSRKFTSLLKNIVSTIDTYGLKHRHLHKHKKEVSRFFKEILHKKCSSEIALKYQKRFKRYKNKLFTFLDFDGVSWNNTNAEHAIKLLGFYRNKKTVSFTKNHINEYLVLMSVYITCLYRNINFLQFLLSKEKDINKFKNRNLHYGNK